MKFETARIHFWVTFLLLLPSSLRFWRFFDTVFSDIFDRLKSDKSYSHILLPVYFVSLVVILKTNLFFSPPFWMQIYSKFWLLAVFCISLERLDRILFQPHHKIFTMYNIILNSWNSISLLFRVTEFIKNRWSYWLTSKFMRIEKNCASCIYSPLKKSNMSNAVDVQ